MQQSAGILLHDRGGGIASSLRFLAMTQQGGGIASLTLAMTIRSNDAGFLLSQE